MAVKAKIANEAILKLDGKEINLDQFFEEEADEREEGGEEIHDDSISENEDKREMNETYVELNRRIGELMKKNEDLAKEMLILKVVRMKKFALLQN